MVVQIVSKKPGEKEKALTLCVLCSQAMLSQTLQSSPREEFTSFMTSSSRRITVYKMLDFFFFVLWRYEYGPKNVCIPCWGSLILKRKYAGLNLWAESPRGLFLEYQRKDQLCQTWKNYKWMLASWQIYFKHSVYWIWNFKRKFPTSFLIILNFKHV